MALENINQPEGETRPLSASAPQPFEQALVALKSGGEIARESWAEAPNPANPAAPVKYRAWLRTFMAGDVSTVVVVSNGNVGVYNFTTSDVLATDWVTF